jgi:hypothetical protein
MCAYHNREALSCNHFWGGKATCIAYSESEFAALGIQHAMRLRHIVICGLSSCTVFSNIISRTARFSENEQNVCLDFLYNFYLKHFSFYEEMSELLSKMFIGLHVKYQLFLSDFTETSIFSAAVRKINK